jgi:HSP20 family protein
MNNRYLLKPWEPFEELFNLSRAFSSLTPSLFGGEVHNTSWMVPLDVIESKDHFTVKLEVPGIEPKDLKVEVDSDTLTIQGERRQPEPGDDSQQVHRRELVYGTFVRQVRLPTAVEAERIGADYQNGILSVRLPKRESAKRRLIPIKAEK